MDGSVAVAWVATNVALAAGTWAAVRRCAPATTWWEDLAAAIVVYWSVVTLACFALSESRLLTGPGVLTAGVALAGALWAWLLSPHGRASAGPGNPGTARPPLSGSDRGWSVCWGLFGLLSVVRVGGENLLRFPTDWDTLMYHLSLPDYWLQAGRLYAPACPVWYNPSSNELLGLWAVAPFSGDFPAALASLPGCAAVVCGALGLGRELGVRGSLAHLAALAAASTYVWQRQLVDFENDVAAAGLFLCCLLFGARYARRGARADLLLAAASLGLLAGVKYYAVGYAAVAGGGVVGLTAAERGRRAAARAAVVGLAGLAVLGAYWYVRNARLTGTPFYPFGVTEETNKLGDYYPDTWRSTFLGSGRREILPLGFRALEIMAGPYHVIAFAALPFLLAWLAVTGSGGRRAAGQRPAARWLLAYATAGAFAVLLVTPWAVETQPGTLNCLVGAYIPTRFGQCFLCLAALALALLLSDLRRLASRLGGPTRRGAIPSLVPLLAAGLIGWQLVALPEDFKGHGGMPVESALVGVNLLLAVLAGWLAWRRGSWPRGLLLGLGVPALGLLVYQGAEALSERWHGGFTPFYDRMFKSGVHEQLDHLSPRAARVCVLDYRDYPFFGSRRQFELTRPPMARSEEWLIEYVRDQDVDVVVATVSDPFSVSRYGGAAAWLRGRPDLFTRLADDKTYVLVRVNRARLPGAASALGPGAAPDRSNPSR